MSFLFQMLTMFKCRYNNDTKDQKKNQQHNVKNCLIQLTTLMIRHIILILRYYVIHIMR